LEWEYIPFPVPGRLGIPDKASVLGILPELVLGWEYTPFQVPGRPDIPGKLGTLGMAPVSGRPDTALVLGMVPVKDKVVVPDTSGRVPA